MVHVYNILVTKPLKRIRTQLLDEGRGFEGFYALAKGHSNTRRAYNTNKNCVEHPVSA